MQYNNHKHHNNQGHHNRPHQSDFIKMFSQNNKYSPQSSQGKMSVKSNKEAVQQQSPKKEEMPAVTPGSIQQISERKADEFAIDKPVARRVTFGMRNLGNTCFFNSVMQCLTHTKALFNYCISDAHTKECKKSQSCFLCLYSQYLKGINQQQRTNPQMIVQKLKQIWQRYSVGRQEDAHEFLIIFMESLVNSCFQTAKPPREFIYKNQNKTAVFQLIGGKSRSQVKCMGCGHCSNTFEDLISLSLEFPKKRLVGACTLEECLHNFYAPEMLKGDNKYMCGGCKKRQEAKKRFSIESTPRSLVIHLKRFTNTGSKIGEFIKYPATLSLKNFMSSTIDTQEKNGDSEIFDLYGVVVHQGGGCRSGHYYSFCKGFDGEWYDCNDDYVGRSLQDKVLRQQAYILFYQKRITPGKLTGVQVVEEVQQSVTKIAQKIVPKVAATVALEETKAPTNNMPGVIVTRPAKNFKEDIKLNNQHLDRVGGDTSLSTKSTSGSSSNNFIDNPSQEVPTEQPEHPKQQILFIKNLNLTKEKLATTQQPKEQDEVMKQPEQPKQPIQQVVTAAGPPPAKKLATTDLKESKDEIITLKKQVMPTFTNLRRDLHPIVNTFNAKKRKVFATFDLLMMPQRQAAILKRYKCSINPAYDASEVKN